MPESADAIIIVVVLTLSLYSLAKFAFFLLPYGRRRAALDKSYDGRAYATGTSDLILLLLVLGLTAALLATRTEPIAFLGGVFVGATLIQLFFHAYHHPVQADREAPEPRSPLKRMSYAIQDRPGRALTVMAAYTVIVLSAVALYFLG